VSESTVSRSVPTRARDVLGRTRRALALVRSRQDSVTAFALGTTTYLLVYLLATGDLAVRRGLGVDVVVASDPFSKLLARTGPTSFEPIALVDLYVVRLLVAPGDVALGFVLAALVGANVALAYLAVVKPAACGIDAGASTGVLAALPALLSGTACCGPVVLLAVGVTASGALVSLFAWLVPIGALSLLASLAYVAGKIAV
jgi:hypothetical protein